MAWSDYACGMCGQTWCECGPEAMTDEQVQQVAGEAARRGLVDVDLSDVQPDRLAAALLATSEGRSALGRLMVARRRTRSAGGKGQKPIAPEVVERIRADIAKGDTQRAVAARHGVSLRTVARYAGGRRKA